MTGDRGNDVLRGGPGHDRLWGGMGRDRVVGGAGNDRINVVDWAKDRVRCGSGRDVVFADEVDTIAGGGCEQVRR
jgi:hypothetical protein